MSEHAVVFQLPEQLDPKELVPGLQPPPEDLEQRRVRIQESRHTSNMKLRLRLIHWLVF